MTAEIPEDALTDICFSEHDAVLLTDQTQFEFLAQKANATFRRCSVFPLSMQAYAAALRGGHARVRSYFDSIDFAEGKRRYSHGLPELARTWLGEMGLRCEVEGIDLAQLDAANQSLLLRLAWYLEGTAERLLAAHPEIETFYLVGNEELLALDFYFDSDVPTAVLRFVCERMGRKTRLIARKQHSYLFAPYPQRPITKSEEAEPAPLAPARRQEERRAGFAPATVTTCQQILDTLTGLDYQTVLFGSTWGMPPLFRGMNDLYYQLTDQAGTSTTEWQGKLRELWNQMQERRERSTLPASILRNPHMAYQLEYIVTERWLSYTNMIERAKRFVAANPLEVFVHSDAFTAEGAVLADFYRRSGTRIVIAPHTSWPCDPNWSARQRPDIGLASYRSASRRLRELSGMRVYATGTPRTPIYKSVLRAEDANDRVADCRRKAGDRKLVVIVTNAPELMCVPFVDAAKHFETIATLARVPAHLADKVVVAIRTKPRPVGEDPLLYQKLCGFSEESVTFLAGLNFSESVRAADCAVGINVPTTGYFEIMERGVPLLHIQTADTLMLHPDLPAKVIGRITTDGAIWPALEAALFDPVERSRLAETQRRFIEADRTADPGGLEGAFRRITEKRSFAIWNRPREAARRATARAFLELRDFGELRATEGRGSGHVDDVLTGSDGTAAVKGWAADLVMRRAAKAIHVFAKGEHLASGPVCERRPDVAQALGDKQFQNVGFWVRVPHCNADRAKQLAFYAEHCDGTFTGLPNPAAEA